VGPGGALAPINMLSVQIFLEVFHTEIDGNRMNKVHENCKCYPPENRSSSATLL